MASFVITTNTTAGQILDPFEIGLLAATGSILAPVGSAVVMSGTAKLISYGALASASAAGIELDAVTSSTLTIGQTGSVVSGDMDLAAISGSFSGLFSLRNAGMLVGGQGVSLAAAADTSRITYVNDGTVQGLGETAGAALALVLNQTSRAILSNTGTLSTAGGGATVNITGNGTVTLTNTGNILNASDLQVAVAVEGGLTLRNSGNIEGDVSVTQSANIFNAGRIAGNITLNSFNDVVRVSGTVLGDVILGNGTNVFWLTGGRVLGTVQGGAGADIYHVDRSDLVISDLNGGTDKVYTTVDYRLSDRIEQLFLSGSKGLLGVGNNQSNLIQADAGDDTLRGLAGNDALYGGDGTNRLQGGFGNDTLAAGEGDDTLDGGPGNDVVRVGYGSDKLYGGSGTDLLSFEAITDPLGVKFDLSLGTATFADAGVLLFNSFESMLGSAFGDDLTGNGNTNALSGGDGADKLYGGGGADTLTGGAGGDTLAGGTGNNLFLYTAVSDSAQASGVDQIDGFQFHNDVISLTAIDAVTGGSDDAFSYLGAAAFTGTAAELRFQQDTLAGTTLIEVRLAGSVVDDMQILLTGLIPLTATNFAF